ncbi:MAG TPA: hypothetical protein VJX67_23720 [Blastocatellia bacterium]|nr:hypothetical protein [Blastocatellia bacterium]
MGVSGRKSNGLLVAGVLLVAAGLVIVLLPRSAGASGWLLRLWPLFLVLAGLSRVMGYAIERKPKSALGGTVLIIVGLALLISRLQSGLNPLDIYGRYWLVLLIIFSIVELLRYYSHRPQDGPQPRLFTVPRILVIVMIVATGVFARHIASSNPNFLAALRLPVVMTDLRDSVTGESFAFTDAPFEAPSVAPGSNIVVDNSYGDVIVTGGAPGLRVTLTKGVRAWNGEDAKDIASRIHIVVDRTPTGFRISTNRGEIGQEFTAGIRVEAPQLVSLALTSSYGAISVSHVDGTVAVNASNSRVSASGINGGLRLELSNSNAEASNIAGGVSINGAKGVKLSGVTGSADVTSTNGPVDLDSIQGPVRIVAPFSRIKARALTAAADITANHGSVHVIESGDLAVQAPGSEVSVEQVNGNLHLTSTNSPIHIRTVSGNVEVTGSGGAGLTGEDLRGNVEVQTSHSPVLIKGFSKGLKVRTSYHRAMLIAGPVLSGDVDVENDHGEIKLVLPGTRDFQLDAQSDGGSIKPIGFENLPVLQGNRLSTQVGIGGAKITLRTSFKDITLEAAPNPAEANETRSDTGNDAPSRGGTIRELSVAGDFHRHVLMG